MSTTPVRALLLPLLLTACVAEPPPPPVGGDTDGPAPPAEVPDTGFVGGEHASLMLTRVQQKDGTQVVEVHGIVADNVQGFYNAAQCAIAGETCFPVLPPMEDDYVTFDPQVTYQPQLSDFGYVGLDITLGPWRAHYVNDGETFPHYYSDLTPKYARESIYGWYCARLDGTWGKYRGEHDIYVSPEIQLISPAPHSKIEFNDTDTILFQWVPDGNGTVFLTVVEDGIGANVTRMYWLEDDGYFELPVRNLGFGTSDEKVFFTLSRWNTSTVHVRGNTLDIVATSETGFEGSYYFVDGRERVQDGDTCAEASILPGVQTGRYWGDMRQYKHDYGANTKLGYICNTGHDVGNDAVVPVDLEPRQAVLARYVLPQDDASIGILRDCNVASGASCIAYQQSNYTNGVAEAVSYFNSTQDPQRIYLILDDYYAPTTGVYNLDIEIQQLVEPPMHDTCVEAMKEPSPIATGTHLFYTDFVAHTPGSDPGANGCTGTALPGPDSMMKVQLQPGETLSAKVEMSGSDPALYLVYQCNLPGASCAAGVDKNIGQPGETLVYTNQSAGIENMFLVIDTRSPAGLRPYTLTLDIN